MGEKLRLLSLFSGVGAWEKAMQRLNISFELVGFSEIDKHATRSYCAIHGVDESLNLGDITQIDEKILPDFDLVTYSFPCQDISVAGKQKGIVKGETRSGLLFDALRIIEYKKPKYALAENVKNLVGKKFKKDFDEYLDYLNSIGYNSYWKVLNAKDFNIPQNRERVFIISIRKDVDDGKFRFPEPFEDDGTRLKDVLENGVDEKYYINQEKADKLIQELIDKGKLKTPDYSKTVRSSGRASLDRHSWDVYPVALTECHVEGASEFITPKGCSLRTRSYCSRPQQLEVRDDNISNTVTTVNKDSLALVEDKRGILINRGKLRVKNECSNCIDANYWKGLDNHGARTGILEDDDSSCLGLRKTGYRIRRLTPLETWRLMDFDDEDFYKAKNAGVSDSQLYKQAGNSIVCRVLEEIFKNLFSCNENHLIDK